jgi:eukaryotic-like serine/threonine-protein kinase
MTLRPAAPYATGYVIAGKYELEEELGQGGMGVVWRARNIALDSPVAIKVVRATADKALLRGRLVQEARAAAKLAHPAIVTVFDVGQTEAGDPFIVMELLRGDSLGKILDTEGRLPAVQAVRSLLPIADALWLAHGKGIVHRDLKPDNVFIVQHDGAIQPTLVDFGIVKLQDGEGMNNLTKDGDVLGSPDYMSPEQARGQDDLTHLTDVWSFCVVLYETVSGRTPFKGSNYNALLRQIVEDTPPSLRELAAGDEELSAIVARGLSKQPEDRYASMGELGRTLAKWLLKQGVTEDICGTTLEAKWLRTTDPHGRAGVPSLTDAWVNERGSGVRRNEAGPLNTLPAPPSAETDPDAISASEAALAVGQRPDVRSKWVWVGSAIVLLLGVAGFAMGKSLLARAPAVVPQAATTQAPAAVVQEASAPAPVPVAALPEEAAAADADAEKRAQSATERVSSAGRAPGVGRGAKSPASTKRSPSSGKPKVSPGNQPADLMSPY